MWVASVASAPAIQILRMATYPRTGGPEISAGNEACTWDAKFPKKQFIVVQHDWKNGISVRHSQSETPLVLLQPFCWYNSLCGIAERPAKGQMQHQAKNPKTKAPPPSYQEYPDRNLPHVQTHADKSARNLLVDRIGASMSTFCDMSLVISACLLVQQSRLILNGTSQN